MNRAKLEHWINTALQVVAIVDGIMFLASVASQKIEWHWLIIGFLCYIASRLK